MYNGIGLQTARGSGTNGYIQRNLSHVKPRDAPRPQSEEKVRHIEPDEKILEHDRKRKVEVKCIELQDELEEQGVPDDQIEERVSALRKELQARNTSARPSHQEAKNLRPSDTHALGAAKRAETAKMERALRIHSDYQEGESFQPEVQERRKLERIEARERRHEESRRRWEERREERDSWRDEHGWRREKERDEPPRDSGWRRERREDVPRTEDRAASPPRHAPPRSPGAFSSTRSATPPSPPRR